jgi:RNA polymerase sigma-70 factor (ECF subfamily)
MPDRANAWTAWLDQHGPALILLARTYVGSRADAEDVVQEAFVRCWRARERIAEPAAYLFAAVKSCALDWRRSRHRRDHRESTAARPEADSRFFVHAEQNERRAAIEAALASLPEMQAEVLVMKIWGGLTFPQIGAALGTSPNTAASRYRYALGHLREQLAEESLR